MPALVQYAEAEAVLKKVQESCLQLENNLNLVLQSRHEPDTSADQMYVDQCKFTRSLGPFHGAIAVPSVRCCRYRRCRGHRCAGGARQYR